MRELFINGRFLCQHATGVQRVSREFVLALERLIARGEFPGLKIRLIVPDEADMVALCLNHITVERLKGGRGYYWEQVALPSRIGRRPLLCLGNVAPLLGLIAGGPIAVMLHDQSYRLYPDDYSRAYRMAHTLIGYFVVRRAQPLITVSQAEAEMLHKYNRRIPAPVVVAPNGSWMNDQPIPADDGAWDDRKGFVLHVGGFSDRKNVDGVFHAVMELARSGVETRLVGQPNARCNAFLEQLEPHLRPFISFTGYVNNDRLAQLYSDASCLIYPSFYEASGLPPSEAMSFGCPVVTSDLPALRERCGDAALYCNPHYPSSIVEQTMQILRDKELATQLSRRGMERARHFTWENQARIVVNSLC